MHALTLCTLLLAGGVETDDALAYEYFANPWGVVGLKDYRDGARIAPEGVVHLAGDRRVEILVGESARDLRRARRGLVNGYLPITWLDDGRWRVEVLAAPVDVRDRASYDGPARGEEFLVLLSARPHGAAPLRLRFSGEPLAASRGGAGETLLRQGAAVVGCLLPGPGSVSVEDRDVIIRPLLDRSPGSPAGGASVAVLLPYHPTLSAERLARLGADSGILRAARSRVTEHAEGLLARGMRLEVPEAKPLATWRASILFQFLARDGALIKPGEGFYDQFYARDAAFQIWSLELAGYLDETRESAEEFLRCQKPDGRFESQGGQLDANGQTLWALWERYRLSRDREWLARVYAAMRRSAEWIRTARAAGDDEYPGVLPRALADGEFLWDGSCHIVGYDLWNLRGLDCVRRAAAELGRPGDALSLATEHQEYLAAFTARLDAQPRPDLPPSYEGRGTSWGNLTASYPTRVLPPDHPRVVATLEREREGFVEGTIRWMPQDRKAIHPYMSTYITNTELLRGRQERVVDDFYHMLAHTTAMQGFPEGVYYESRTGWSNTLPHQWASAQYMILLRNMLLREEGDSLHLLSAVPPAWLLPGKEIIVERAPTALGRVGVRVTAREGGARVDLALEDPARVREVVLHLPPTFREGPPLHLPGKSAAHDVRWTRSPPSRIRTFRDYALEYDAAREQLLRPVSGLLEDWDPVPAARARPLDLARVAVTDPRRAPFGVDTGGKLTFRGLPTGDVVLAGVPFRLLDPAANGGKGLVVLRGQDASRAFPASVEVPVGLAGRRIFFLGGVGGWTASEPSGTVAARLAIEYEDGESESIPLRVGATIDDWLQPPSATQARTALAANGWHLHLLAVPLRPARVRRVRFEDAGTMTAPVLAAITVETP